MTTPIAITKEMKQIAEIQMDALIKLTNERIEAAFRRGESKAIFPINYTQEYYYRVRRKFEAAGYRIRPVSQANGRRSLEDYIEWGV